MRQLSPKQQARRTLQSHAVSWLKIIAGTLVCAWIISRYGDVQPWYIQFLVYGTVYLNLFMGFIVITGLRRWWQADDSHPQPNRCN